MFSQRYSDARRCRTESIFGHILLLVEVILSLEGSISHQHLRYQTGIVGSGRRMACCHASNVGGICLVVVVVPGTLAFVVVTIFKRIVCCCSIDAVAAAAFASRITLARTSGKLQKRQRNMKNQLSD